MTSDKLIRKQTKYGELSYPKPDMSNPSSFMDLSFFIDVKKNDEVIFNFHSSRNKFRKSGFTLELLPQHDESFVHDDTFRQWLISQTRAEVAEIIYTQKSISNDLLINNLYSLMSQWNLLSMLDEFNYLPNSIVYKLDFCPMHVEHARALNYFFPVDDSPVNRSSIEHGDIILFNLDRLPSYFSDNIDFSLLLFCYRNKSVRFVSDKALPPKHWAHQYIREYDPTKASIQYSNLRPITPPLSFVGDTPCFKCDGYFISYDEFCIEIDNLSAFLPVNNIPSYVFSSNGIVGDDHILYQANYYLNDSGDFNNEYFSSDQKELRHWFSRFKKRSFLKAV
ncbi:hypothetical protein A3715_18180 [Oleiphilus sp. HI0009]|nr:hypothetical protein A3715_18180 [Oleiphilus sp. HI0009]